MKPIHALLLLFLFFPALALAQQDKSEAGAPVLLDKNIVFALSGSLAKEQPISFSISGYGSRYVAETVVGFAVINGTKIPVLGTVEFSVAVKEGAYEVTYNITIRRPVVTSTQGSLLGGKRISSNIEFRDQLIEGTATCAVGRESEILKSGDHSVGLTVQEVAAK